MEVDPDARVIRQDLQKRKIGLIAGTIGHLVEVAERLMAMGRKYELQTALLKGTGPKLP